MTLAARIKQARQQKGFTQEELSAAVRRLPDVKKNEFTQQTVSKLESGASTSSSWIAHICAVTGVDYQWLAFNIDKKSAGNKITTDASSNSDNGNGNGNGNGNDNENDNDSSNNGGGTRYSDNLRDWIVLLQQLSADYERRAGGLKLPSAFHVDFLECGLILSLKRSLPTNDDEREQLIFDINQFQNNRN